MSQDISYLEEQIKQLKSVVENNKSNASSAFSGYLKNVQGLIYLLIIVIGIGITWGMTSAKVSAVENIVQRQENQLRELQINEAGDDKVLENIQKDIQEMKQDIKKLVNRNTGIR